MFLHILESEFMSSSRQHKLESIQLQRVSYEVISWLVEFRDFSKLKARSVLLGLRPGEECSRLDSCVMVWLLQYADRFIDKEQL
jgi:hypothetical protein